MKKKGVLVIITLLTLSFLLITGCKKQEVAANTMFAESNFEKVSADGENNLYNINQWNELVGAEVEQEQLNIIYKEDTDNGYTNQTTLYPSAWENDILDEYMPPYEGYGILYLKFLTERENDTRDAKKTLKVSQTVYNYALEDLNLYIENLKNSGFEVVPEEIYTEEDLAHKNVVDGFVILKSSKCSLKISVAKDEIGNYLDITVSLFDRVV